MGKTEIIATIILFNLFFLLFIIGIIIFIRQYKTKKNEHENKLKHKEQEHQQELLATQLEIQTQTMQYIGREIHDNIGQKLTLASLYTQQLAYENKAPHINDNIENIGNIINDSLAELRQLSKSLTDDRIDELTLEELLKKECEKIHDLKKCNVNFSSSLTSTIEGLSYQCKSILLRISQEFMQNSIKHAQCKNIFVEIHTSNTYLHLLLKDDGKGFDSASMKSNGIGLQNMKKRTEMLKGNYEIESLPEKGTLVNISVPLTFSFTKKQKN